MKIGGKPFRTIWLDGDGQRVRVIDQTKLPHRFETVSLASMDEAAQAIGTMIVRGAPLIGATAAFGMALAMAEDSGDGNLARARQTLSAARPTAINLRWAVEDVYARLAKLAPAARREAAYARAAELAEDDVATNAAIGKHGLDYLRALWERAGKRRLDILTHCNAGWLACVDWGTATAPIYMAHDAGIPVHVWVDETRPRNQGASLTAWELGQHGVDHTVIVDNAGGHLMQRGRVDVCIVGTDRVTRRGDVCNKIGTYPKALTARDNDVPFLVALPHSTIDWTIDDGIAEIPIEERAADEVTHISGLSDAGEIARVRIAPEGSRAANYGFDVTPARLVSGLVTERGICAASAEGLASLYPDRAAAGRAPSHAAAG